MTPQPVLIVARPAEGGIRSHITQLLAHLDRDRFCVGLAAPAKLIESLPGNLPPFSAFSLPIAANPNLLDAVAAARIIALAQSGYSLIHAHGVRAGLICALARSLRPFKLVVSYHNLAPTGRLPALLLKTIACRSDSSIAVSRAVSASLAGCPCAIIPNGIDVDRFQPADRKFARAELGVSGRGALVACVARLSAEKGVDILIRAARLIPDIAVLIAGDGPERFRLEAGSSANIRFLGYVAEPSLVFCAADIVVIPSRREGQGIVALEAMASGAAVIATTVGGLPEMIVSGQTGLLTPPEDASALAQAIRQLTAEPLLRARLAEAGRKWVLANADVQHRIDEIQMVYAGVMAADAMRTGAA